MPKRKKKPKRPKKRIELEWRLRNNKRPWLMPLEIGKPRLLTNEIKFYSATFSNSSYCWFFKSNRTHKIQFCRWYIFYESIRTNTNTFRSSTVCQRSKYFFWLFASITYFGQPFDSVTCFFLFINILKRNWKKWERRLNSLYIRHFRNENIPLKTCHRH